MNERIHACLNGEVPLEALSAREQAQLREMQAVIGAVADRLHAHPVPDLAAQVMRALPAATPGRASAPRPTHGQRLLGWLWTPRPIPLSLRPAYALAGLLALLLALPLANEAPAPREERIVGAEPAALPALLAPAPERARVYVQFRLEAPDAEQVALAGSFTGWQPEYRLRETAPGVWTALVPLQPGVHDYAFLVDGERWMVDPHAFQVRDSFGGKNSRISLPAPREST
ncbi:MAG TPA: glycogen-binding domain-containing protein [Longimicrobiaceae bacterium]|nr:glycogen-binding domain-containing protein [Longimicrobiaceae bacterium]